MRLSGKVCAVLAALVLATGVLHGARADNTAQGFPTDTPAPVDLSGAVPAAQPAGPTETPTRTPTPQGPVQIEAVQVANVRANPDPEGELLGQIRPGEFYNAIRRYYRWIEFQYDPAPTRRGWVYDELVRFVGDESAIPSVESLDQQPEGAPNVDATSTALAITATPGGLLTATAQARMQSTPQSTAEVGGIGIITPSGDGPVQSTAEPGSGAPLPTFTYPPGILPLAPTVMPVAAEETPTEIPLVPVTTTTTAPPVLPIAVLGGLGLLGLLASAFRR